MAKGFVGGFLYRNGGWISHWVRLHDGSPRRITLETARTEIVRHFAAYCGGEAVARRNTVLVDALCPKGREALERIFAAMQEPCVEQETDETEGARRQDSVQDQAGSLDGPPRHST